MSEVKIKPINIPERQLTTSQQTSVLLNVCGMFWSMLQGPPQMDEGLPKAGTVQGEARTAAELTFIKACEALQLILEEKPRWDFSFQQTLEKDYAEAMSLNRDFLIAQRHSAREHGSPHFIRNPVLHRLTDGSWMAILGDLRDVENAIIGVGKCPQEALEAFDQMFNGITPASVEDFINKHTYETTNEQEQKLDGIGDSTIENPTFPRQDDPGDSKGTQA